MFCSRYIRRTYVPSILESVELHQEKSKDQQKFK